MARDHDLGATLAELVELAAAGDVAGITTRIELASDMEAGELFMAALNLLGDQRQAPAQTTVGNWQRTRWPDHQEPLVKAGKVCEEAGEVMGAVIKSMESDGRKTQRDIEDEAADVQISLLGLAEVAGFSLAFVTRRRWAEVEARNYGG